MSPAASQLLLGSCGCLLGFACSGLLLMRSRRSAKLAALRLEEVAGGLRAQRAGPGRAAARLGAEAEDTLAARAVRLLRYDPSRPHVYGARPAAAVALALAAALALAHLVAKAAGPLAWLGAPPACVLLCRLHYGRREARFHADLYGQFPDALAMIVRAVRVGLPVVEAIRVVARESPPPTAQEFAALVGRTAIGVPLDEALRETAARIRLPEYRFFATALSLQSQTGGGLTEALENLADTIRKRVAAKKRGHALAAEARMSSYILGGLPIVTGAMLAAVNPDYMAVLFYDPSGRMLLLAGAALLTAGALTMRSLIRRSLS